MSKTYAVELTVTEWMDITLALGHMEGYYRARDMEGQAIKFDSLNDEIVAGLNDD